jgi:hypothetical protein
MQLKNEVLWEVLLGAPYDPSDTYVSQTELVA